MPSSLPGPLSMRCRLRHGLLRLLQVKRVRGGRHRSCRCASVKLAQPPSGGVARDELCDLRPLTRNSFADPVAAKSIEPSAPLAPALTRPARSSRPSAPPTSPFSAASLPPSARPTGGPHGPGRVPNRASEGAGYGRGRTPLKTKHKHQTRSPNPQTWSPRRLDRVHALLLKVDSGVRG